MPNTKDASQAARILLVDDSQIVRDICSRILAHNNFTPVAAENGLEALHLFEEKHSNFAVIVSDISMPVMGGVEFARKVLKLHPESKIILMTGYSPEYATPEDLQPLCTLLPKPFTNHQLIAAVRKSLAHREEQAA